MSENFTYELDTVVIGSGPGGYVAAIRAAQEGQQVAIVEKEYIGGVCLNVGCIPSKALISASERYVEAQDSSLFGISTENVQIDWDTTQEWKENQVVKQMTDGVEFLLKQNNVEIIWGTATLTSANEFELEKEDGSKESYSFNNAIIATGSTPIEIGGFEFKGRVLDSTGGLNLPEIPESLVVVGGGYIGSELAGVYARLGTKVTILEGAKDILGGFDKDMVRLVKKEFEAHGTEIIGSAMAKEAVETDKGVTIKYEVKGEEKSIDADYVMVTVGRFPNTKNIGLEAAGVELTDRGLVKVDDQGRTNVENIYAIGDIVDGAALAHKASYEGKVAAEAISGKDSKVDYLAMPAVAFTAPELASAGHSRSTAKDAGLKVKQTKFQYQANGRAVALGKADGFVKIITEEDTNKIVGAHVAGHGASDLISELTLAIEQELTAEDVADTIHAHPTLGEMVLDAAEGALGKPIHG